MHFYLEIISCSSYLWRYYFLFVFYDVNLFFQQLIIFNLPFPLIASCEIPRIATHRNLFAIFYQAKIGPRFYARGLTENLSRRFIYVRFKGRTCEKQGKNEHDGSGIHPLLLPTPSWRNS